MHAFATLLLILASTLSTTSAEDTTKSLFGVYFCPNINFSPRPDLQAKPAKTIPCTWLDGTLATKCQKLSYQMIEDFAHPAERGQPRNLVPWTGLSIGPDPGVVCNFWLSEDCGGDVKGKLTYPGTGDLGKWGVSQGVKGAEGYEGGKGVLGSWRCAKK